MFTPRKKSKSALEVSATPLTARNIANLGFQQRGLDNYCGTLTSKDGRTDRVMGIRKAGADEWEMYHRYTYNNLPEADIIYKGLMNLESLKEIVLTSKLLD